MTSFSILFALVLSPVPHPAGAGPAQVEGRPHPGPAAYHIMCRREPALCAGDSAAGSTPGTGPVAALSTVRWTELEAVNALVNARLRQVSDATRYGVSDYWTAGGAEGDCEDFVIAKKQALIAAGWAPDQLLYAVVEGSETAYHAVLIVRTDRGDLVLDNLSGAIVPWERSGYRFVVRQSAADPRHWVSLRSDPSRMAAGPASGE